MECPQIPELGYGSFSKRLHERVSNSKVPAIGTLELTHRCNLRCAHCYLDGMHELGPGQSELSTEEIKDILDQIAAEGCLWLLLTGGEPLVRRDFVEIYTYAKRKGFLITLFTNGTRITPAIADLLVELPPFSVEISLYGRTRETYEEVTGVPGSHQQCLGGIRLLLDRGIPLKLKTSVMTLNKEEVPAMKAFADSLGVSYRFDPLLNVCLDGCKSPVRLRLTPREIIDLGLADADRKQAWQEKLMKPLHPPAHPNRLYHCGAGRNSFHIDPYGQVVPCVLIKSPSFDLRTTNFRQDWPILGDMQTIPRTRPSQCATCKLVSICAQCPGWSQLEYDDPEEISPYLCEVTHLRASAFGSNQNSQTQEEIPWRTQ